MFLLPETLELFPNSLPGTVTEAICSGQDGRIKFQASQWPAQLYQANSSACLLPGQNVQVIGRKGLTLLVRV